MYKLICAGFALALASGAVLAGSDTFHDPLDVPASVTRLAAVTQMSAVTHAGARLVAVGIRGLIVTSDDGGISWTQRAVPVSSDLLAVQFATPLEGWAVGHDGVVLHSADGGVSWIKQLDGRHSATLLIAHFKQLANSGDENGKRLLKEMQLNYDNGPEQALLDVWFEDAQNGFVCGSFGTLLATRDGGKTWQSWVERVDSSELLHLNALRGIGGALYMASEKGIVFRLDRKQMRFLASPTGYSGSFFSLAGQDNTIIAAGLRGSAYRSLDGGVSWDKLDTGLMSAVTALDSPAKGRFLLTSQGGDLLLSTDNGSSFKALPVHRPTLFSGLTEVSAKQVVLVGLAGVQKIVLN